MDKFHDVTSNSVIAIEILSLNRPDRSMRSRLSWLTN